AVAVRSFRSVLDRSRAAPDELNVLSALTGAAMIAARRGDARRAAWLFAAAAAERERLGIDPRRPWNRESNDRAVVAARESLGAAGFAAATAQGWSRPLGDALAEAAVVLADGAGGRGSAAVLAAPYGLSRREREVLRVLARGASDKEIAAALFIERSTASKHVAAVLAKLGVTSRAAAAAIAARAGLA
ncbi:MAG: helix-turn-helix transcriptional regulator, partial [Chloroflexia bacterium]|nr:helix-turn-helix transcriptional regulator [Chloroflexia bacterium]